MNQKELDEIVMENEEWLITTKQSLEEILMKHDKWLMNEEDEGYLIGINTEGVKI